MKSTLPQVPRSFRRLLPALVAVAGLAGCSTPDAPSPGPTPTAEKGLHGTVAYLVQVEASEPGTKIEVNHQSVGVAPVTVKVFGDRDGTFHNFGSDEFVVRGYPPRTELFPQTKIFRTGAFGIKDDRIPQRIYFDFGPDAARPR